ncbi:MAG TPA: FGGY-family carbohydrate kinase [Anaerovoracaceae bacterium]|nr:FGGY-family carbohydrate kinase [Anaerovoracaceae bacterium]
MSGYVLGIDVGTTSVKVVLVSKDIIVDEATAYHDLLSPYPNWAEEDAGIWWKNIKKAVSEIAGRHPDKVKDIAAIGCSGMVPAIVLLDKDGEPVRNTIQQNDARAISQIERIKNTLDQEELFRRTGGFTNQQHILPRLLWVKENEPETWAKVDKIMGSYDYAVYKLTGTMSLEINWAVESGSYDIHTNEWIKEDLEAFGVDPAWLPQVNESMKVAGTTLPELEKEIGIPGGIPVIAGSADHVASTLAAGITQNGDLLIKFGGAGDILYCVDEIVTSKELFFDYHIVPGEYLLNGCMAASGSLVKWFTNDILECYSPSVFKELDAQAELIPPASEGLIILPYFLGEKTPIFDPIARGVMFGLTLSHTKAHIFRAILEAVIYGFRHHVEVIREAGFEPRQIMATNGGAKSKFWCQIAADILGQTICSFPSHPGSALGVAFLAGKSAGLFQEWQEIQTFLTDRQIYEPDPRSVEIYNKSYNIYRDIYRQLKPSFEKLQRVYEK